MVCIPDFLGKMLLKKNGFHIPRGLMIGSMNEVMQVKNLELPLFIKPYHPYDSSQHSCKEYKAYSYKEVLEISDYLLRTTTGKEVVSRLYFEEEIRVSSGYQFTIRLTVDGRPIVTLIRLDFLESAAEWEVDYLQGFPLWVAEEFWNQAGFKDEQIPALSLFAERCYNFFVSQQLTYLDIGDFCMLNDELIVKTVNMNIDDFVAANDHSPIQFEGFNFHFPRQMLTANEQAVAEINDKERNRGWVHYVELPSNSSGVAVCFGGTGLSFMMMDFLYEHGIVPVNLTDLSSGVSEKKLVVLLTAILQQSNVKMFIVVINFFQFSRVDVFASALVTVLKKLNIDPVHFPIIVRLTGPGAKGAHEILSSVPGIDFYTDDIPFEEIRRLIGTIYLSKGGVR
jgi:succinyl-CoA synthetase beta subunit